MDLGYGLGGSDSLEWRAQMWDERGRESGPTLTFKPSSSPDTRHNNLLPAATQFNDLWGGHHLKPPMQKNTFSGNIWQRFIPLSKTPPVAGKSIVWHGMKIVCLYLFIYVCIFHLGMLCFAASVALLKTAHRRHVSVRLCRGNGPRREWWKEAVIGGGK